MDPITPCLWFERQALDAVTFYTAIFPNSRVAAIHRAAVDTPGAREGEILFVEFELNGRRFQALNGGSHEEFNNAISLSVPCDEQSEVDRLWTALIEGGGRPIQCGWLKDRYGVSWQIVPKRMIALLSDPDLARRKRALEAMMTMVKLDIPQLEAAAAGRTHP